MSTNEYIRKKWSPRPQIDLAKEIAKKIAQKNGKECGEKDYIAYKGYVNKWFKSDDHEPAKAYLLLLSEILNVSVESLLRGEDIVTEYGERPTAYAAAISGDERMIERLFGNAREEVCLDDKDEYNKSFVDYVVEFKNYRAFQIAINKGYNYPTKWEKYLVLKPKEKPVDFELTKMIVEADDLEMFKKAFGRLYRDDQSVHVVYRENGIPADITALILKSHHILEWLMQIQPFTDNEWIHFNGNMEAPFLDRGDDFVCKIPSMVYRCSYLLQYALANEPELLNVLLNWALEYVKRIKQFLGNRIDDFGIVRYERISTEFGLCLKYNRAKIYVFVPYIENAEDISNDELRKKAEEINATFQVLEY